MLNIKEIFPAESYTRDEIYATAEANRLQVDDTQLATFTILEIVECFHEPEYRNGDERAPEVECDLSNDDHETVAEFRNDVADGSRFYLDA